jgi:hypothetical protein
MLIVSAVLALVSLAGLVWIFVVILMNRAISVDNLFTGLILLTMFGILFLNVFLELRDRGLLKKKAAPQTPQKPS